MNKKQIIIFLSIALLGLGILAYIYTNNNSSNILTLYGNVDIRNVSLGFRVPGKVDAVYFQEGDHIKKGDLLASLDQGPLQQEFLSAEAQLDSAKAQFTKLRTGNRPEEILQADAVVRDRQAVFNNAERVNTRMQELYAKRAISQQARDDAFAAYDAAKADLDNAKDAQKLAHEGFRTEDILSSQADLKKAQAQYEAAKISVQDTHIYAMESGNILTRIREPGAILAAGSPVFDVSLDDPVWVRTYVTEPDLGRVRPGQKVLVYTDSRPNKPYAGKIGYISTQAEFTPKNVETTSLRTDLVYRLRVVVTNDDGSLRQGMPVTVKILMQ